MIFTVAPTRGSLESAFFTISLSVDWAYIEKLVKKRTRGNKNKYFIGIKDEQKRIENCWDKDIVN
jgi:hypothetical protein